MSEVANTKANPVVQVIRAEKMKNMFEERLGKRAGQFTTSLISVVNNNKMIAECEPMTVIQAALTAASMDLPINQNLGFAYIVPYNNNKNIDGKWVKVKEAQFQMGYKGFIQLAQRSGQFKTINTTDVREGELKSRDRMTGELKFEWIQDDKEREKAPVIGYLAYFELTKGFSKSLYMSKADVEAHAGRYSQAYRGSKNKTNKSSFSTPWEDNFDLMAQKTALKLLLNRFAPLSTEMQEAITADQSVNDGSGARYIDNDPESQVKASDDKKSDILAANQEDVQEGEVVEDDPNTEVQKDKPKDAAAAVTDVFGQGTEEVKPKAKAAPKKSVKEMADERWGKGKKGTQESLIEDNDSNS